MSGHLLPDRQKQAGAQQREHQREHRGIPHRQLQSQARERVHGVALHVPNRYPAPRSVVINFGSKPSSILRRKRPTSTSSTLANGS